LGTPHHERDLTKEYFRPSILKIKVQSPPYCVI